MRRVAHVHCADRGPRLPVHPRDRRDRRRVRVAVVGRRKARIRRDHHRRVALAMLSVIVVGALLV